MSSILPGFDMLSGEFFKFMFMRSMHVLVFLIWIISLLYFLMDTVISWQT
jgi:hypothetical protein